MYRRAGVSACRRDARLHKGRVQGLRPAGATGLSSSWTCEDGSRGSVSLPRRIASLFSDLLDDIVMDGVHRRQSDACNV
jgi:hypothetical protein